MKKLQLKAATAIVLFCLMSSINLMAQASPQDYFIGKWDMLVKGLPQGDTHMAVVFEMKKDSISGKDEIVGHLEKTAETEEITFSKIEPGADKITFYFTAQGYDIDVFLSKKDDDNADGKFFNMFETVAIRVKK